MRKLFLVLFVLVLLLTGFVLFNTFRAKPWPSMKASPLAPLPDSALAHMSEAIRIPTISPEGNQIDSTPFVAYRSFLQKAYPSSTSILPGRPWEITVMPIPGRERIPPYPLLSW